MRVCRKEGDENQGRSLAIPGISAQTGEICVAKTTISCGLCLAIAYFDARAMARRRRALPEEGAKNLEALIGHVGSAHGIERNVVGCAGRHAIGPGRTKAGIVRAVCWGAESAGHEA